MKKNTIADMTIYPDKEPEFELPPPDECEEFLGSIVLGDGHELRTRFQVWKDRYIVEFAIMQITGGPGNWHEVARVDTCHSKVHRHQLRAGAPDNTVGTVIDIVPIPQHGGWEVVDKWYGQALTLMQDEWEDNLRRWGVDSD